MSTTKPTSATIVCIQFTAGANITTDINIGELCIRFLCTLKKLHSLWGTMQTRCHIPLDQHNKDRLMGDSLYHRTG